LIRNQDEKIAMKETLTRQSLPIENSGGKHDETEEYPTNEVKFDDAKNV